MTTTNNPTANLNLTDAECDAILRRLHADVRPDRTAINIVDWTLYRRSQYANFDEAVRHGAITEMRDVFGYTSAVDSLLAMEQTANLLDHRSATDDVRIIITVDNVHLPECALADATHEIHRHMVRQGWYTITPSN